jgi:ADP-L-glycero-D-manno-heptose 6-epimerase
LPNPKVSGVFNLGTGEARSFVDLMQAIGMAVNKPVNIDFVEMPESIRPNYQYFTQANMAKLRAAGYLRPMTSLEDGVRDYVTQYLQLSDPYR